MPVIAPQSDDGVQFAPQGPPQGLPADPGGTGANGPQYSALDTMAAAARGTVIGRALENVQLMDQTGVTRDYLANPLNPLGMADNPKVDTEGLIPASEAWRKDKYVGLHTAEEINYRHQQLLGQDKDAQMMAANPWTGGLSSLVLGQGDPVGVASLFVPVAAATRLQAALKIAGVGGAVSAADELLMHQMDPNATLGDSAVNVGEGTLIAGLLGAVTHSHVPADELARLKEQLRADLNAPRPVYVPPEGDNAAQYLNDLRARLAEVHQSTLARATDAAAAAVHLDPAEVTGRVETAQKALEALEQRATPPTEEALAAEMERMQQPASVKERLDATYGEDLPHVLRQAADERLRQDAPRPEELEAARAEHAAALEDADRIARAQKAAAALERFHVEHNQADTSDYLPAGAGDEHAGSDFEGLRSELPPTGEPGEARGGESRRPAAGGAPEPDARGAEGAGGGGREPLTVYRGAGPPEPGDFEPGRLREPGEFPTAGLGPKFTNSQAIAARAGPVTAHHLDIRNPLELRAEELPRFASPEEAANWRDAQEAAGYDGLVIDHSPHGGATTYVPFRHEQVLPAGSLERAAPPTGAELRGFKAISGAPAVERSVLAQVLSTGRYARPDARMFAAFMGDFYGTQAKLLGITADEMFQRYPLHVLGEALPDGLAQSLADPFYSAAIRHVETLSMGKATPEQWLKTLENATTKGVSKEELDWLGVRKYLEGRTGTVTRDELLAHMRANQVAVKEVRNGYDVAREQELTERLGAMGYDVTPGDYPGESPIVTDRETGEERHISDLPADAARIVMDLGNMAESVRYDQYTLPGGQNYKEHLITLMRPRNELLERRNFWASKENESSARIQTLEQMVRRSEANSGPIQNGKRHSQLLAELAEEKRALAAEEEAADRELSRLDPGVDYGARRRIANEYDRKIADESRRQSAIREHDAMMESRDRIRELERARDEELARHGSPTDVLAGRAREFNSGHWATPDILAHVRTNERIGADGKRELHIEEIQSDWHQAGRDNGYDILDPVRREARIQELNRQIDELADKHFGSEYHRRVREWLDKQGYGAEADLHQALHDEKLSPAQRREANRFLLERDQVQRKSLGELVRERDSLYQHPGTLRATTLDLVKKRLNDAIDAAKPSVEAIGKGGFANARDMYQEFLKDPLWWQHYDVPPEHRGPIAEALDARRRWQAAENQGQNGRSDTRLLPDAPFKKTWPELAFKAMVRHAAENGFDRITWTRGATQAERYAHQLRSAVDSIKWHTPESNTEGLKDNTITVSAHKNGSPVFAADVDVNTGVIKGSNSPGAKG